jgi:hypothetical protein
MMENGSLVLEFSASEELSQFSSHRNQQKKIVARTVLPFVNWPANAVYSELHITAVFFFFFSTV